MTRTLITIVTLLALAACEGPVGPQGPAGSPGSQGPAGPQGPRGPAGPGANFWFGQGFADDEGLYAVRFDNQTTNGIVAQCWTRATTGPWVQLASAEDSSAPQGAIGCVKEQDGADVIVAAATYAFWEVLIVAVAVN